METIPIPDSLPVPWPWFQALLLLTFLLHLILINFVLGGSLLTLTNIFKGQAISKSSKSIPTLIALAINMGVPPLLFIQVLYGHFFYSSSIIMAWPWLLIVPILILAYYGAYIFIYKYDKNPLLAKVSLAISTLIMLIIAFLFVNNITLMLQPDKWIKYFENPSGWNLNLNEITLIPRYLHFIVSSIAVAGIGKAAYALFSKKLTTEEKTTEQKNGLRIFAFATMIQILVGIYFLLSLPKAIMMQFMGQNILFTILLLVAILITVYVILSSLKGKFKPTLIGLLGVLVIMVFIRDFVRHRYLIDVFTLSSLDVTNQYGSMILFLAAFVLGLYALYYMINILIKSFKS